MSNVNGHPNFIPQTETGRWEDITGENLAEILGDPRFHAILKEMGELHDRKQQDYGSDTDAFANVRASEQFGVEPWIGALVRLNDKVTRLQAFARKGELANESAEDSMLDIAVYAIIALILYREEG